MKYDIVIYAVPFEERYGGSVVLYSLAEELLKLGLKVGVACFGGTFNPVPSFQTEASSANIDENTVVVYPEIVEGNPLGASRVVRWILCKVGVHRKASLVRTWGQEDLVFHYSSFDPGHFDQRLEFLTVVSFVKKLHTITSSSGISKRSKCCVMVRKGHLFHGEILPSIHPDGAVFLDESLSLDLLLIEFKKYEYMYCYDPYTFHMIYAALSGCVPIIVPMKGVNKEDWVKSLYAAPFLYQEKRNCLAGVAWGLDDIPHAVATLSQVAEEQFQILATTRSTIVKFGSIVKKINQGFHPDKSLPTVKSIFDFKWAGTLLSQFETAYDEQTVTLNQSIKRNAELKSEITTIRNFAESMRNENARLKEIIESAKRWQRKAWFKRAFRRWRASETPKKKLGILKRFERSFRKRRNRLFGKPFVKRPKSKSENLTSMFNSPKGISALDSMLPLEDLVKRFRKKSEPSKLLVADELKSKIVNGCCGSSKKLLISVSHDHYLKVVGGVQLCIQHEEKYASERGIDYLQIHPWQPLPRLAHTSESPDITICLVLNGLDIGECLMSQLLSCVKELSDVKTEAQALTFKVIIHQMLGYLPEQLTDLIRASGNDTCIFWLHDFFSICSNHTLIRNSQIFCDAPSYNSNSCQVCFHGKERESHINRFKTFFQSVKIDVVSPSVVTADFWKRKFGFHDSLVHIVPHMKLKYIAKEACIHLSDDPQIIIAFLGAPAMHKGWPVFIKLIEELSNLNQYKFVVMSATPPNIKSAKWVDISVSVEKCDIMLKSVQFENVDLVIHWPAWPETFSFTAFEALAGKAYVITNSGSGNVAVVVRETGCGVVLSTEFELLDYFRTGKGIELAKVRRKALQTREPVIDRSKMSFELLEKTIL